MIVPIEQVSSYLARGFELYEPVQIATEAVIYMPEQKVVKKTGSKKSRQLLELKTEVFNGNYARKD